MKCKYFSVSLIFLLVFSLPVFSQKLFYDNTFAPVLNGSVNLVEVLGSGKILISGNFTIVNGTARNKIARLNSDGTLDEAFDANSSIVLADNPVIYSMEVLSDGKILLGGDFGAVPSQTDRKVVIRLNSDGTFDNTLTAIPHISAGMLFGFPIRLRKAEPLPGGKILICGLFQTANGNPQPRLARYNSDGSYDSTFTNIVFSEAGFQQCVDVEAQPDGKYFVSGSYTTINGNPSAGLRRFNADDTVDTTFINNTIASYNGIELSGDGTLIAAFQPPSQLPRAGHFNAGGDVIRLYDSTETSTSDYLTDVADTLAQANGKVFIVDGRRERFYRYNADGTRDASLNKLWFHRNDFPNGGVKTVSALPDGKILIGGNYEYFVNDLGTDNTLINQKFLARFTPQAIPIKRKYDFDGDGKDDLAVFRPSNSAWYLNQSSAGFYATVFGLSQDKPVVDDYDGDGKADIAVFRDGVWYWLRSSDSVFAYGVLGQAGDIPLPGRYSFAEVVNGLITFRPSAAKFIVQRPFLEPYQVGMRQFVIQPTDTPLLADFNGDGKNDLGVFRDGHWYIDDGTAPESKHFQFGVAGDKPLNGDFDGDGRADISVFRPSTGEWWFTSSQTGQYSVVRWGTAGDIPVPADFDGDGKTDIAVYRPSDGIWYQLLSSNGSYRFDRFGLAEDIPAQSR